MKTMKTIEGKKYTIIIVLLFIVFMVFMFFAYGFHSGFPVSQWFSLRFSLHVKSSCENIVP